MYSSTNNRTILTLCAMIAAVAIGCSSQTTEPQLAVGLPAPAFQLAKNNGNQKLSLESLKGEIVVVNFWSTSCAVCLQELDSLKEIHNSGKAKVVGIALDEDGQQVRSVAEKRGLEYPVLIGDQATFERFDGFSIPYTLVVDRSQVVRKRFFGRMIEQDFDQVLQTIEQPEKLAMHSPVQARSASFVVAHF